VIEIEFESNTGFEVRNEILIIQIGKREFLGAGAPDGSHYRLTLRLTPEQFANLNDGEPVIIKQGRGARALLGQVGPILHARIHGVTVTENGRGKRKRC
jgi:hypothetical protein